MEMDSLPTALDEIERRIRQLGIERDALRREEDPEAAERLLTRAFVPSKDS